MSVGTVVVVVLGPGLTRRELRSVFSASRVLKWNASWRSEWHGEWQQGLSKSNVSIERMETGKHSQTRTSWISRLSFTSRLRLSFSCCPRLASCAMKFLPPRDLRWLADDGLGIGEVDDEEKVRAVRNEDESDCDDGVRACQGECARGYLGGGGFGAAVFPALNLNSLIISASEMCARYCKPLATLAPTLCALVPGAGDSGQRGSLRTLLLDGREGVGDGVEHLRHLGHLRAHVLRAIACFALSSKFK